MEKISFSHGKSFNAVKKAGFKAEQSVKLLVSTCPWSATRGDAHGHYFFNSVLLPALGAEKVGTVGAVVAQAMKADKAKFAQDSRTVEQAVGAHLAYLFTWQLRTGGFQLEVDGKVYDPSAPVAAPAAVTVAPVAALEAPKAPAIEAPVKAPAPAPKAPAKGKGKSRAA
jgi:hypothetical protein